MIQEIEARVRERWGLICRWFLDHSQNCPHPVYSSVDIRNSGFKVAVVDTNLYPSGFNNLCQRCFVNGPELFQKYFQVHLGQVSKILIIPESHTRNLPYLANLVRISSILEKAGYQVRTGFLPEGMREDYLEVPLKDGETVHLHRIRRQGDEILVDDFVPDLLLVNNDFSSGPAEILEGIRQPVVPPLQMGWFRRRKSQHIAIQQQLIQEFCRLIDWDPWLLTPLTDWEEDVNFLTKEGLDRVAAKVDMLISRIREKYDEYGLKEEPYAFIKNDSGTYGMAIVTASSGDELLKLNRKERVKMHKAKGGTQVRSVLIQEGIPTRDRFGPCWVEPVIYLVGDRVLGGFLRENCRVSRRDNLNTTGMTFTRPCLHGIDEVKAASQADYFPMIYDVISKIAALAAGHEMKNLS